MAPTSVMELDILVSIIPWTQLSQLSRVVHLQYKVTKCEEKTRQRETIFEGQDGSMSSRLETSSAIFRKESRFCCRVEDRLMKYRGSEQHHVIDVGKHDREYISQLGEFRPVLSYIHQFLLSRFYNTESLKGRNTNLNIIENGFQRRTKGSVV